MTEYILIRSKRKTISIHITKDATVEVRAPLKATTAEINRFIASKQDWINKHLSASERSLKRRSAFSLNYGDTTILRGREYPITMKNGNHAGFDGECFYLPPGMSPEEIKQTIIQVYRITAKQLLTNRVIAYSEPMGVVPSAVKVNGATTRWGSCSGKNSLNFSWRLIMADDDVIDYIVVHELAHIREHNHSHNFWAVVESVIPDYKKRRKKLYELQKRLANEDWE